MFAIDVLDSSLPYDSDYILMFLIYEKHGISAHSFLSTIV